jgi:hypothetical protein
MSQDTPPYYQGPPAAHDLYAWMRTRPPHAWATWGTPGERQTLDALYGALVSRAIRLPYKGTSARVVAEEAGKLAVDAQRLMHCLRVLDEAGEGQL